MRLSISLLHYISFYTLKCLAKCDIICCLSGFGFTLMCLYQPSILICIIKKESPKKKTNDYHDLLAQRWLIYPNPWNYLTWGFFGFLAYYEKSSFMHITLLLKRVEPISDDLLFPNWKHWVGSGKILKSFRKWLGVLFWWLKSSGQNAAEGQNGATNTPWALDSLSCFMGFGIRCIGGY